MPNIKIARIIVSAAMVGLLSVSPSLSSSHGTHAGHGTPTAMGGGAAETEYRAAMEAMHEAMSKQAYTGDADLDFAKGMVPHHQAAIEMARTVLKHGQDPEIRKLAEEIIAAQAREIEQLNGFIAKKGR